MYVSSVRRKSLHYECHLTITVCVPYKKLRAHYSEGKRLAFFGIHQQYSLVTKIHDVATVKFTQHSTGNSLR
ncbi:hypothetical protein [Candidatus Anaplasma sp. TIGMIC]|uniref:hypothetical protein n=1 Tax=Candidatus Anaplasma sp. TIGMIC TaxID=3020713 RepID=UPI00232F5306|nr:hypothetical protein [Candidatus Anaplasma sp. TIGMIC]